ncbi:MAG: hypothetical protein ACRDGR_01200 [bacterium]
MKSMPVWLAISSLAAGPVAAKDDPWLHVAIDGGVEEERVRVNLPLSFVEAVLPRIEAGELRDELGRDGIQIGDSELSREDVAAILAEARTAADGQVLAMDRLDESVRVAKEGEILTVRAQEDEEVVEARVPLSVLEALFSGNDELDLLAAVRALEKHAEGVRVEVEGGGETVRVWIDRENQSD